MTCIKCGHDCHCKETCNNVPAEAEANPNGCDCGKCVHYKEEPMARKIWEWVCWPFKKVWDWLKSCLPNG